MDQPESKSQVPTVSEIRRERERAEMVERIMDVAREMFVRDGYEAVTLRKIAASIEYSPASIYQYFKDKQALVTAIIQKDTQDLRRHLRECLASADPVERIREMARLYAAWGIAHPNHYRLLLVPPETWEKQENILKRNAQAFVEQDALILLLDAVKEIIRQGRLKDKFADPSIVAATLWAGIHGAIMLEFTMSRFDRLLFDRQEMPFEERFAMLREVFVEGFLKHDATLPES